MKIKKNGKTINLTEADIRKLSKSILKESTPEELEERVSRLEQEVSKLKSVMDKGNEWWRGR
jgi:uncharacterized protein YceH (UPF0502 family)